MIRNVWVYLWICLFVVQVASVIVHRKWMRHQEVPVPRVEPALLELAERTNQMMQAHMTENPVIQSDAGSRSDTLIQRESLILELHRMQQNLQDNGVETHIVEDLEAFLGTSQGNENIFRMNAFIEGIVDWLQPHASALKDCHLERLSLFPDYGAGLPVLAFELAGSPASMAQSLLWSAGESSRWDLIEIDLLIPDNEQGCWLRGSFAFLEPTGLQ